MRPYLLLVALFIFSNCNNSKTTEDNKLVDTTHTKKADPLSGNTTPGAGKIDVESFGTLKLGQSAEQVLQALGKPTSSTKPIEWEADGLMHEDWLYPEKGLSLNFAREIDS